MARHTRFYELITEGGGHLAWASTDAECKAKAIMLLATRQAVYVTQRIGVFQRKPLNVQYVFKKEPK